MRDEVFEYHSIRSREVVRHWVREILVLTAICSGFMFLRYRDPYENLGTDVVASVMFGVPIALALWGIYRVLRFALGR